MYFYIYIGIYTCAAEKVEHFVMVIDLSCQEPLDDCQKAN